MAFQNCSLGCCSPSMLLDGIQGHGKTLHDLPPMPTAPRQEIELPVFDSPLHELSLNTVNAPAASWFQELYASSQYSPDSFDMKIAQPAQPAQHRAICPPQITAFDTRSTQEQMWRHLLAVSIEETSEDHQGNAGPGNEIVKCQWKGCLYTGTFGRKTDLMRHLETQHVSPKAYKCPFPGCGREYNRDDNLQGHLRIDHGLPGLYR